MSRRTSARSVFGFACGFTAVVVTAACLDTTPLRFERESPADAGVAPEAPACRQCLSAEGPCQAAYEQCRADTTCWDVIDCSLARSCLSLFNLNVLTRACS